MVAFQMILSIQLVSVLQVKLVSKRRKNVTCKTIHFIDIIFKEDLRWLTHVYNTVASIPESCTTFYSALYRFLLTF